MCFAAFLPFCLSAFLSAAATTAAIATIATCFARARVCRKLRLRRREGPFQMAWTELLDVLGNVWPLFERRAYVWVDGCLMDGVECGVRCAERERGVRDGRI
ncbi:hypothetical protein BC567DRAFT_213994 [Phyllosticta citribraziliensis]